MKTTLTIAMASVALVTVLSLSACKEKTPAEKLGDAIEDAGKAAEEAAENAAKELEKAAEKAAE